MALERKDVRAKLDADMHTALTVLCEVDGVDLGEFIEMELVRVIQKRCHAASVIAERTARLGITGNGRESPGTSGNRRE
jgi:hypothetical protein